jgi:hypothetical protein
MRRLTTMVATFVVLAGTSVATFAGEGNSPATSMAATAKGNKGAHTTSGAAGIANHPNPSPPGAVPNPPPSAGCGTVSGAMKQGC